jgi:hypothetical protein
VAYAKRCQAASAAASNIGEAAKAPPKARGEWPNRSGGAQPTRAGPSWAQHAMASAQCCRPLLGNFEPIRHVDGGQNAVPRVLESQARPGTGPRPGPRPGP